MTIMMDIYVNGVDIEKELNLRALDPVFLDMDKKNAEKILRKELVRRFHKHLDIPFSLAKVLALVYGEDALDAFELFFAFLGIDVAPESVEERAVYHLYWMHAMGNYDMLPLDYIRSLKFPSEPSEPKAPSIPAKEKSLVLKQASPRQKARSLRDAAPVPFRQATVPDVIEIESSASQRKKQLSKRQKPPSLDIANVNPPPARTESDVEILDIEAEKEESESGFVESPRGTVSEGFRPRNEVGALDMYAVEMRQLLLEEKKEKEMDKIRAKMTTQLEEKFKAEILINPYKLHWTLVTKWNKLIKGHEKPNGDYDYDLQQIDIINELEKELSMIYVELKLESKNIGAYRDTRIYMFFTQNFEDKTSLTCYLVDVSYYNGPNRDRNTVNYYPYDAEYLAEVVSELAKVIKNVTHARIVCTMDDNQLNEYDEKFTEGKAQTFLLWEKVRNVSQQPGWSLRDIGTFGMESFATNLNFNQFVFKYLPTPRDADDEKTTKIGEIKKHMYYMKQRHLPLDFPYVTSFIIPGDDNDYLVKGFLKSEEHESKTIKFFCLLFIEGQEEPTEYQEMAKAFALEFQRANAFSNSNAIILFPTLFNRRFSETLQRELTITSTQMLDGEQLFVVLS